MSRLSTLETILLILGVGSLANALRDFLISWRERSDSERRMERAFAAYRKWVRPMAFAGVVLLAVDAILILYDIIR
ncbi:MAG: hypothetical protein QOK05_1839 [Chloroflexota bacterium]|jgi:predicted MarR family transcription regulator|nr:hypothetical protein [Chloroflexota bacterium]